MRHLYYQLDKILVDLPKTNTFYSANFLSSSLIKYPEILNTVNDNKLFNVSVDDFYTRLLKIENQIQGLGKEKDFRENDQIFLNTRGRLALEVRCLAKLITKHYQ